MGSRPSGDPKIRAKDIFSAIDVDQDGTLTCEEFVKGENINLSFALLISYIKCFGLRRRKIFVQSIVNPFPNDTV